MFLYRSKKTRQPSPGAMAFAFLPAFSLPAEDALGFSQYRVRKPLRVTQPEQVYINAGNVTAGLGGIVAGQLALQGLINNGG